MTNSVNKIIDIMQGELCSSEINNLPKELLFLAIRENPDWIKHVENQTEELCLVAVLSNAESIQYIRNQTEKICHEALNNGAYTIKYIHNQTKSLCKKAIKISPSSIEGINNQTEELCWLAIKSNIRSISSIKNPSKEMLEYVIEKNPHIMNYLSSHMFSERQLIDAISKDYKCLLYVNRQTPSMIKAFFLAVPGEKELLHYIKYHSKIFEIPLLESYLEGLSEKAIKFIRKRFEVVKDSPLSEYS